MHSYDLPSLSPRTPQIGTSTFDPNYSMSEMEYHSREQMLLEEETRANAQAANFSEQAVPELMGKWLEVFS